MADSASPIAITLYGKPGCHLCEDAEVLLMLLGRNYALQVTTVDITADAVLFERYQWEIPVIVAPWGQVRGRVSAADLRALLEQGH